MVAVFNDVPTGLGTVTKTKTVAEARLKRRTLALQTLGSFVIPSSLVLNCFNALRELGKPQRMTMVWAPGHEGIKGNERAAELAKPL